MRNVIYTATIGERDDLRSDQTMDHCLGDEEWIAFSDRPQDCPPWELREGFAAFKHPCPNSRNHKALAHQWLPSASYSLWIDANMALRTPLSWLIDTCLKDCDIALFKHWKFDCIYQVQEHCETTIYHGLPMKEQVESYRAQGWPEHAGYWQGGFILRRHTKEAERFNNYWWAEISRWGWMDEIALPVAIAAAGVKIGTIPGNLLESPFIDYRPHKSINHLRAEDAR